MRRLWLNASYTSPIVALVRPWMRTSTMALRNRALLKTIALCGSSMLSGSNMLQDTVPLLTASLPFRQEEGGLVWKIRKAREGHDLGAKEVPVTGDFLTPLFAPTIERHFGASLHLHGD